MAASGAYPVEPSVSNESAKAVLRYRDGYRLSRAINGLGQACKIVGILTGIGVIFFGVLGSETVMRPNPYMATSVNYQTQHNLYLISAILLGALIAFIGWVIGVIVAGYGQHLKAALDEAVHTSPFLTDSQRAQVMRLV